MSKVEDFFQGLFAESEQGLKRYDQHNLPPVEKWNPPLSGDIDIVIKRNGDWIHEGRKIERHSLVQLFASILKKESDEYFLVTPAEKWRLQVEDVPFVITQISIKGEQQEQCIDLKSNIGDSITVSVNHPLTMMEKESHSKPYVLLRSDFHALLHRNVFYELAEKAVEHKGGYGVWSDGIFFALE